MGSSYSTHFFLSRPCQPAACIPDLFSATMKYVKYDNSNRVGTGPCAPDLFSTSVKYDYFNRVCTGPCAPNPKCFGLTI